MLAAGRWLKNILTPPQAFLDWCFSPLSADVKNRQSQQFLPSRPSAHLTLPSSSFFILFTAPKTLWKPRTIYIENVQFESSWPTQLLQFNLTRISTSISPKDMFWFGCFNPSIFGQNPWDHWPGFTAPWTRNRPTITLSLVSQKDDLLIEKWLTILIWAVFLGCFFRPNSIVCVFGWIWKQFWYLTNVFVEGHFPQMVLWVLILLYSEAISRRLCDEQMQSLDANCVFSRQFSLPRLYGVATTN